LGCGNAQVWNAEDIAAIFRYQMDSPVVVDLSTLDPAIGARLALLAQTKGLLLRSFRDLLLHPSPPLELLKLAKNFAKANRGHPESVLPEEVAAVLYFACIAVALVRCSARITKLDAKELAAGLRWSAEQPWVDAPLKALLTEALRQTVNPS
jgi:hypothetical protein